MATWRLHQIALTFWRKSETVQVATHLRNNINSRMLERSKNGTEIEVTLFIRFVEY